MKEEWKIIDGTNGRYEVSNTGKVRNLDYRNKGKIKEISQRKTESGRMLVTLFIDGNRKDFLVHRLVATAFIPNPDNLPEVNHGDGNPQNNYVNNLEWCDRIYNMQHAYRTGLMENAKKAAKITVRKLVEKSKEKMIPITAINMETAAFQKFDGINQAAIKLGIDCSYIVTVLKGKMHTTKGYTFVKGHEVDGAKASEIVNCVKDDISKGFNKQTQSIIEQRGKSIIAIDKDGNETLYSTIIEASRKTDVARSSIRKVAKGTQKRAKGYIFKYAEERG